MSSANEPEGALKLAATMVGDQIRVARTMRARGQQMADLLGRTIALASMLDEAGDGEVVLVDPDDGSNMTVADQVEAVRDLLLTWRELDASFEEQLGTAQMLYDRFLERHAGEEGAE